MNGSSPPELQQFKADIQLLLKPCNPQCRSLSYFIRRSLCQFNLQSVYTEYEILHEAYLRGIKLTEKEVAIRYPAAWIRTTAFNVVREWSREARRYPLTSIDRLTESQRDRLERAMCADRENGRIRAEVVEENLQAVQVALQELTESDRAILQLSIVEGHSWKQIREHFILIGEPGQTEMALRKRKQRILERLRKLYHQQTLPI